MTEKLEQIKKAKEGLFIKTFGCQMNQYDSEKVATLLGDKYRLVESAEEAELVFVNTCSVREKAEHKLYSLLGTLRELKQVKPDLIVGVGGCVAQQEGEQITRKSSAVDFVVGTHNLSFVPSLVESAKNGFSKQVAVSFREDWESIPEIGINSLPKEEATYGHPRALIAIQRGCNKRCSFCVVPNTRGPEVSRRPEEIILEAKKRLAMGAKELLLLGQTVNSYGRDLSPRFPFEKLIRALSELNGVERIRFISPHPAEVKPEFLKLYKEVPTLVPHIHLPLQSGSDRVLKLMNRNYKVRRFLEIVDEVRSYCPEISITTDVIVGFPTESDEDFESTLSVMKSVRFQAAYSYKYSVRPNTTASVEFPASEQVSSSVSTNRLIELQELQDCHSLDYHLTFLAKEAQVLVEEKRNKRCFGRNPQNIAVEIDSDRFNIGEIAEVEVVGASPRSLRAVPIENIEKSGN